MRLLALIFLVPAAMAQSPALQPAALRCEHRSDPLGIDETKPRLSWQLAAANTRARGLKQSAYRIQAASTREGLRRGHADLWDTGKVESDQSVLVPYQGRPLTSGIEVWWRVRVWDQSGAASAWSRAARWSMGLLQPGDWQGKWIGWEEKGVYKNPRSPFQLLGKARWIWYPEGDPV
ncbi:MAG: hypothetical protein IT158_15645, partial [Bryobacterales bacterium]|nr:hypothetical protein [Bryobacterales bacterium]